MILFILTTFIKTIITAIALSIAAGVFVGFLRSEVNSINLRDNKEVSPALKKVLTDNLEPNLFGRIIQILIPLTVGYIIYGYYPHGFWFIIALPVAFITAYFRNDNRHDKKISSFLIMLLLGILFIAFYSQG